MRRCLVLLQISFLALTRSKMWMMHTSDTLRSYHGGRNRSSSNDDKIHGGSYVRDISKFPWMVSIMLDKEHDCGGGLLTLDFVLTACHCVADIPEKKDGMAKPRKYLKLSAYKLVAGTVNIRDFAKSAQVNHAKSLHYHPKCQQRKSLLYDSGLIKTRKPFRKTRHVQPLKMLTWDKHEFGKKFLEMFSKRKDPKCVVSGWGDPRKGEHKESIATGSLKMLRMGVMTEKDCHKAWRSLYPHEYKHFNFWNHGQICVASENLDESDCTGDSGSPFVCNGYVVATVSYGTAACAEGAPSVYQTMSEVLDWVKKDFKGQIKENTTPSHLHVRHRDVNVTTTSAKPVSSSSHQPDIVQNEILTLTVSLMMLTLLERIPR